jgi:hypothetical protein
MTAFDASRLSNLSARRQEANPRADRLAVKPASVGSTDQAGDPGNRSPAPEGRDGEREFSTVYAFGLIRPSTGVPMMARFDEIRSEGDLIETAFERCSMH